MKTVLMRRSGRDRDAALDRMFAPPQAADYPPGLHVELDNGSLKKLGVGELPAPGDRYRVGGELHVTGVRQDGDHRQVDGVLHQLGLEPMTGANGNGGGSLRDDINAAVRQQRQGRIGARFTK